MEISSKCDDLSFFASQIVMAVYAIVITYFLMKNIVINMTNEEKMITLKNELLELRRKYLVLCKTNMEVVSNRKSTESSEDKTVLVGDNNCKAENINVTFEDNTIVPRTALGELNLLNSNINKFDPMGVAGALYNSYRKGDGNAQKHLATTLSRMGQTFLDECDNIVAAQGGDHKEEIRSLLRVISGTENIHNQERETTKD